MFLHRLFLENEAQINKTNYATMLFMSKQVSLPKKAFDPAKIKSTLKAIYAPFARKPSITLAQNFIGSLTHLDNVMHEQIII